MSDETSEKPKKSTKESVEAILSVARRRLETAIAATSDSREDELDDLKFAAGSPDNLWQWEEGVVNARTSGDGNARPCLTINKLPQHIHQVTNDQRQNRPSGNVIPANSEANVEVAEVFNGMVRHIEYISNADVAYDTACENQVTFGEGYIRIVTDYTDEDSFDQDIFVKRVRNSFSVYMDTMIQDPCGEDAEWCFIIEDMTKADYEQQYPDASPVSSLIDVGVGNQSFALWVTEDTVRIAEYFRVEKTYEKLNLYPNGKAAFDRSVEDEVLRKHLGEPVKSRKAERRQVKWIKTNGLEILDERDWPGKHIPVVRVIGNEYEIEGKLYISGIVRNAKDAQRMYNYNASQEAEMLALSPKAPFLMYGGQAEGYEDKWKTANTHNWPYLEVNPDVTDAEGRVLPLPQRVQPPMVQNGLIAAKQAASEDIKETTGQYNASLGQTSNERSGKAILARQHEGDKSTYQYVDNLARAVRYVTRQIVDLIPKIYDAPRTARILGEDKSSKMVKLDPTQKAPVTKVQNEQGITIEKIYNPNVGKYDVMVVTGPGYASKRQEARESMATLLQGNPELWAIMGDLFVKNMDWPGAQEMAKRLARSIDPKLMGDGEDDPALQQAHQQIQTLMQELEQAHNLLSSVNNSFEAKELQIKAFEAQVKAFQAETQRIVATAAGMTPEQMQDIVTGTIDAAVAHGDLIGQMPEAPQMEQPQPQQQMPGGTDAAPVG